MKKTINILFAFAMILSIAFIGDAISSNGSLSVKAQTRTGQVTVKRKRTGGVVGGAKYVYRKGKNGVVYVYRKTAQGTVYVGKRVYQGGKYVTVKTVEGTKYAAHKTKRGAKAVTSRTKKIILGDY